ncbi:MAG: carboxylating nicotinate-nucleotide diphosphorylase [Marinospirillum sp.]|uniref:carboxylating nicotinate-nucleotide diphosphorylase n=1 Tax=Marinospirillum sp. TaxID=2183934 RepID=UPI0019E6E775|nr:carboxylating nicotinate-nucleotide diphosphorylase [Marinospirillum sp.]MBE0507038.1 carboxylating nicotinate-nucleotide diphosphorylase [Marinospirillum sp.]
MAFLPPSEQSISLQVQLALQEDVGDGDITAQLIPANRLSRARVITRQPGVFCGGPWVREVFRQLDSRVQVSLLAKEGERLVGGQTLFILEGPARALLTGERTALNFVQTLAATATRCRDYADRVAHTRVRLLDTRKTLPGMRLAQKYAVTCGGCFNHRIGLFDAFLIKENHIAAAGGIAPAVAAAKQLAPGKPVEVEVENLDELDQALIAGADWIMLDEFSVADTRKAVTHNSGRAKLEASGGITLHNLVSVAETGVDYISLGTLTKDIQSLDLSMRITD